MLDQERKNQLDGIVQTMIDNNETDENIRFIIDDFKKKYSSPIATKKEGATGLAGIAVGVGKGALNTLQNIGKLSIEAATLGKADTSKLGLSKETLKATTPSQKIGKFGEQVAEFAIPATKLGKITQGANLATKIGSRALTSGTIATLQEGKVGAGTGIAAGTEVVLPVAGRVVKPFLSRLMKGLGAGLSGVPIKTIDTLIQNPKAANEISKRITQSGGDKIIEENAKTIINGVSQIRKEAGQKFSEGLQTLKAEDINPTLFKKSVQTFLDKIGSSVRGNERIFENIDFDDPKNIQRASNLIDDLSKTDLDGYSLRKLVEKIDKSAYKIATSDERLSFNSFIREMSGSIKTAINESTDKLKEINKAYSQDLQLTEAIEDIFKDVNYKNLSEVAGVARKIENLFTKKGLDSKIIDDFLTRIGIKPGEFRASEAVRQISGREVGANQTGVSLGELTRTVTSAVVTPELVKDISIKTGYSTPVISELLRKIDPALRGTLLEILTSSTNG